jgi:hypothetical protein
MQTSDHAFVLLDETAHLLLEIRRLRRARRLWTRYARPAGVWLTPQSHRDPRWLLAAGDS